jgi:hypothetical protein
MNANFQEIANAAKRLHWNYGKGDVQWVHVFADGRIELCAKRTSCKPTVYTGRLTGKRSVRLHGRQTRIGYSA